MQNKKGVADGKGVAILLLLIALFMILYILLLPPEQRDELLNESISDSSTSNGEIESKVLLLENPGYVYPTKESNIDHEVSSINLFLKTEPETSLLANSLETSKSLFNNKPQKLTFDVEDTTNLKSIILFFSVEDKKGNLIIKLNDHLLFEGNTKDVETIELPIDYIKKSNVIEIISSSPGILFWTNNFHDLKNVGIKEVYQLTNPKEERIFSLPKDELNNLETGKLEYRLYCNRLDKDVTNLKIFLNDYLVLDKITKCVGGSESIEIDKKYFREGNNKLEFLIGEGDFQFSDIVVNTNLKESVYPTYHFEIDNDDFKLIKNEKVKVKLKMSLNVGGRKRAELVIDDKNLLMDTEEDNLVKDITGSITIGDNFIRVVPQNTFYINTLQIKLE